MSQDQLQIFHAAFRPRVKSPRSIRRRELDRMLNREANNLDMARYRVHRMQRDELIDDIGNVSIKGQTLLDKMRDEDKTAKLSIFDKEKRLQTQQNRMRKMVRAAVMSVEERLSEASPRRIPKTGNIVVDRVNARTDKSRQSNYRTASSGRDVNSQVSIIDLGVTVVEKTIEESPLLSYKKNGTEMTSLRKNNDKSGHNSSMQYSSNKMLNPSSVLDTMME